MSRSSDPECSDWTPCRCKSCRSEGFYDQDETCMYYVGDMTTGNDYY